MSKKIVVSLIFGGRSAEHEISLASAAAIHKNLDRSKFEVRSIYITRQGLWRAVEGPSNEIGMLEAGPAFSEAYEGVRRRSRPLFRYRHDRPGRKRASSGVELGCSVSGNEVAEVPTGEADTRSGEVLRLRRKSTSTAETTAVVAAELRAVGRWPGFRNAGRSRLRGPGLLGVARVGFLFEKVRNRRCRRDRRYPGLHRDQHVLQAWAVSALPSRSWNASSSSGSRGTEAERPASKGTAMRVLGIATATATSDSP